MIMNKSFDMLFRTKLSDNTSRFAHNNVTVVLHLLTESIVILPQVFIPFFHSYFVRSSNFSAG
jgi:hypothetical protein